MQPMNDIIKIDADTLAETSIGTDTMYQGIYDVLKALLNTTVSGKSEIPITPAMQAVPGKQYIPDTEIQMLQNEAVPMSDTDVKDALEMQKRITSVQYRQEQLTVPDKTLAEITGSRVRVAYRLIRYMAHVRGVGETGKPLILSMGTRNGLQISKATIPMPFDPTKGWYRGMTAIRNLLAQAAESPYRYSYLLNGDCYTAKGMSIMPPPIHDGYYPKDVPKWKSRREQYVPATYRADTDAPLATYLNICELLVRHIGIAEEDIGEQAAVAALLNPTIARLSWPCWDDIETFEEYVLLPYIGRIMVKTSQDAAVDTLKKELRLTHAEAFDLMEMYKTYAQQANVFDPVIERSLHIAKLQRLGQECSESQMVTTQLKTYEAEARILGLTKHDDDSNIDRRTEFSNILEADIIKRKKPDDSQDITGSSTAEEPIKADERAIQ